MKRISLTGEDSPPRSIADSPEVMVGRPRTPNDHVRPSLYGLLTWIVVHCRLSRFRQSPHTSLHCAAVLHRAAQELTLLSQIAGVILFPFFGCLIGNWLMLASGQGQEFLREYGFLNTPRAESFMRMEPPQVDQFLGVLSIWTIVTWYTTQLLLTQVGPRVKNRLRPFGLARNLSVALPRFLGVCCFLPLALFYPLVAVETPDWILSVSVLAMFTTFALTVEATLNASAGSVQFNVSLQVISVVIGALSAVLFWRSKIPWFTSGGLALMFGGLLACLVSLVRMPPRATLTSLLSLLSSLAAIGTGIALFNSGLHTRAGLAFEFVCGAMFVYVFGWGRWFFESMWGPTRSGGSAHDGNNHRPSRTPPSPSRWVLTGTALVALALTYSIQASPLAIGHSLSALPLAILAISTIVVLGSIGLVLVPRLAGLPSSLVASIVVFVFLTVGRRQSQYVLRDVRPHSEATTHAEARPELRSHFLETRARRNLSQHDPVIVAVADGGGIRAALVTAFTLSVLDELTCYQFSRHLYAISAVSGGALGAAAFAAGVSEPQYRQMLRASGPSISCEGRAPGAQSARLVSFFLDDFLSPVLAAALFPDLLRKFIPLPFLGSRSRANALEETWEHAWGRHLLDGPNAFAEPFLHLYGGDLLYQVPLLFLNATSIEDGRRAIVAPVKLEYVDSWDLLAPVFVTGDLKLSTAVHNSARFPLLSPAGTVLKQIDASEKPTTEAALRLVDGGYFDNSGGTTALEVLAEIARIPGIAANDVLVLVISNEPRASSQRLCGKSLASGTYEVFQPATPGAVQPLAVPDVTEPVRAVVRTLDGRTTLAKRELLRFLGDQCDRFFEIGLTSRPGDRFDPPLAWALSSPTMDGLNDSILTDSRDRFNPDFERLAKKLQSGSDF